MIEVLCSVAIVTVIGGVFVFFLMTLMTGGK